MNPLAGKPLRYLIGADHPGDGEEGTITVVPYDAGRVPQGISVGYCNLFDETDSGAYGPYLHSSDTARDYDEGQIDPHGPGWFRNLDAQFARRKRQGFDYIELDNPDAYAIADVIGAVERAARNGLKVVAKNPLLVPSPHIYLAHPNIHGAIVEKGGGIPSRMHDLRSRAGRPDLPVWFVAFGASGRAWSSEIARVARGYRGMGVTHSTDGEYGNAVDLLRPRT